MIGLLKYFSVRSVLKEVKRLLKPGGIFISITFAQPHFRHAFIIHSSDNIFLVSIQGYIHIYYASGGCGNGCWKKINNKGEWRNISIPIKIFQERICNAALINFNYLSLLMILSKS